MPDISSRDISLVFKPWRTKEPCDQCDDYHQGLELLCNGDLVEDALTDPHGSLDYNWEVIAKAVLKHLKSSARVAVLKVNESSGMHTLQISFGGRTLKRRLSWYDSESPGTKGLAFLRRMLEFVGFDPTIQVDPIYRR